MEDAGFTVTVEDHKNMNPIKQKLGIKPELASCHTAVIGDYVFEGIFPLTISRRF
ncbi:CopG protein [Vibrio variabilis]|nr:CopG protein [Vibrio variabilis]